MSQKVGLYVAIALAVVALLLGGYALVEAGNEVTSMGLHPGSTSNVSGNLDISGTFASTGASTFASTLDVAGLSSLDGGIDVDSVFTVADATGLVTVPKNVSHVMTPVVASVDITYTAAAGGTGTVLTIPASQAYIIHDLWVETTTNFDATGDDVTLVIGDGNDADGFCVLADAEVQAAYAAFTGASAGWACTTVATRGLYYDEAATNSWIGGMVYDGTDTIDWLLDESSGETITAGAATVWVLYTRIK